MTDEATTPRRGRPPKALQERAERRRRNSETMDGMVGQRLTVEEDKKAKDHRYRWINDDKSRIAAKTEQDDWDLVADEPRRQVGVKPTGEPLYAHLARKPEEFCVEDEARKQRALDEQMNELAQGRRGDTHEVGYVATDVSLRDGRRS